MSIITLLVAVILICILLLCAIVVRRPDYSGGDELRGARLYLNEKTLRIRSPISLSGRPDQVWLLRSGMLVIIDTKRRPSGRICNSDNVQLSANRLLLENHPRTRGYKIAPYGFIRLKGRGTRARFVKVNLLPTSKIVELHKRARAIKAGRHVPRQRS